MQINITIDSLEELERIGEIIKKIEERVKPENAEKKSEEVKKNFNFTKTAEKKKKVDVGKLLALHKAGWKADKIADELRISVATVYNHLSKARKEGKL